MATFPLQEKSPLNSTIPLSLFKENALLNQFTGEVILPPDIEGNTQYLERTLRDMRTVLHKPDTLSEAHMQTVVHRIYRFIGDSEMMKQAGLKYDITVILPGNWGGQLPTTTGHYHLPLENGKMASPDFYQLLYGEGLALLQKEVDGETEMRILRPKVGEWMLFPPQYAHSTINIGKTPAVFANICVRKPHLNYEPILSRHGMVYYVLRDGIDGYRLERNVNYKRVADPEYGRSTVRLPELKDVMGKSFYWLLTNRTNLLGFLVNPDSYPNVFYPDPIEVIKPDTTF